MDDLELARVALLGIADIIRGATDLEVVRGACFYVRITCAKSVTWSVLEVCASRLAQVCHEWCHGWTSDAGRLILEAADKATIIVNISRGNATA